MMTRPETAALNPETLLDRLEGDKYRREAIRWNDCGDHYELVFTDNFVTPCSSRSEMGPGMPMPFRLPGSAILTDLVMDMKAGDRSKEVHVFVGSFGGEVAALNMILQQLLTYKYRVGINLGTACSCGWMLLFACHERYVSPFSQAMYHDISCMCAGKHSEMQRSAEFMNRWQKELLKCTDTEKFLTPRELELAQTSEVWFTGSELIERGAARDYTEYLARQIPCPAYGAVRVGSDLYVRGLGGKWARFAKTDDAPLTYPELLEISRESEELPLNKLEFQRQTGSKPKESDKTAASGGVPGTDGEKLACGA